MTLYRRPLRRHSSAAGATVIVLLLSAAPSWAQAWTAEGPEVLQHGQVEGQAAQQNPVEGDVEVVVPVPGQADQVILASVNGGIWRTTNFSNASPTWTWVTPNGVFPATDPVTPLSLGALAFSRNNDSVAYAGLGDFHNFSHWGTAVNMQSQLTNTVGTPAFNPTTSPVALLRSNDAGATWSQVSFATGFGLVGVNISGVQARAKDLAIVTGRQDSYYGGQIGVRGGLWRGRSVCSMDTTTSCDPTAMVDPCVGAGKGACVAQFIKLSGRSVCSGDPTVECDPAAMPDPCVAPAKGTCTAERNVCSGDTTTLCDRTAMPDPCAAAGKGSCGALPAGDYTDVVNGPGNISSLYTSVVNTTNANEAGIYRSLDAGQTWAGVYTGTTAPAAPGNMQNIRLAGRNGTNAPYTVYAAIATPATNPNDNPPAPGPSLNQVVRIEDAGFAAPTVVVLAPAPTDGDDPCAAASICGMSPGLQGIVNISVAGDPTDANVVYIGGDRQPGGTTDSKFPNRIGAADYSGRLFRGNVTNPATGATTWTAITHNGTNMGNQPGSAPHADSRALTFLGSTLYEGDDGGIYEQSSPANQNGVWRSKIGTGMQITEVYAIAYDRISDILLGSNQDTGAMEQHASGSKTYDQIQTVNSGCAGGANGGAQCTKDSECPGSTCGPTYLVGDGGVVLVDNTSQAANGRSVRYGAQGGIGAMERSVYNAANNRLQGPTLLGLNGLPSRFARTPPPFAVNAVDGRRLVAGVRSGGGAGSPGGVWESKDQGDNFAQVKGIANTESVTTLIAGGRQCGLPNPDLIFAGTNGPAMYRRVAAKDDMEKLTGYAGRMPWDLVVDPEDWSQLFVVDILSQRIWRSTNADAAMAGNVAFTDITNNLLNANVAGPGFIPMTIEFVSGMVAVGGLGGVYVADATAANPMWSVLGTDMPNAIVMDLAADAKTGRLFAGTLGRGIWSQTLPPPPKQPRHYECYETPAEAFASLNVTLDDAFGTSLVTVRRRKRLCNPAVKNCEDPTASSDPEHLTGYVIKQVSPPFVPIQGVPVSNQFGLFILNLNRPDYMLVPAAKSLSEPPPPLVSPDVDHFKCYRTHSVKTRVPNLLLTDQFGQLVFDVRKPMRFCVAASKNGEGMVHPLARLLCYKGVQLSLPKFRGITPLYLTDQFGAVTTSVDHIRELCLPSSSP